MTERVGWHCTASNRYGQATEADLPTVCPRCGRSGSIRRIDHPRRTVAVAPEDVVSCRIVGETGTHVAGEVVDVGADRVVVEARDGTGRYAVTPEQIETPRRSSAE